MKFDENNKEINPVIRYKVKKCLKCGSETNSKDDKEFFCSQCGAPILNKCTNYECQEILDEKAKFCKYCGSPSLFYNYDFFKSTPPINDDLPF